MRKFRGSCHGSDFTPPFNPSICLLPSHQFSLSLSSFFLFHLLPSLFSLSLSLSLSDMKIPKISPKKLFRSKKNCNVARSDPSSFSSGTSSSSDTSSSNLKAGASSVGTPTSVLPSGDWSDISSDCFELVQAFKLIDRDGDGKISRRELEALLSRVGAEPPSEEELMMMLSEVDRDGDGSISLEEFGTISSAFGPPACGSELRDTFDFFDTDHDGKITAEELFGVFSAIGDERCTLADCKRMIDGVDKNRDGFVCFEDFSRMMELQG